MLPFRAVRIRALTAQPAGVLSHAGDLPIMGAMIDRFGRVFLVGMFPLACALAGCDVEGTLGTQDGGVGGTAPSGPTSGICGAGGGGSSPDAGPGGPGGSAGAAPDDGGTPAVPANLLADSGFEAGNGGWTPVGNPVLSRSTEFSRTGAASLHVGNRTMSWEGAGRQLLSIVTAGATYELEAWVRLASAPESPAEARLTLNRRCATDGELGAFSPLVTTSVGAEWTLLQGTFEAPTCDPTHLLALIEIGAFEDVSSAAEYYVDDVSLTRLP